MSDSRVWRVTVRRAESGKSYETVSQGFRRGIGPVLEKPVHPAVFTAIREFALLPDSDGGNLDLDADGFHYQIAFEKS